MFVIQCRSPTLTLTQTHYSHSLRINRISYFLLPNDPLLIIAYLFVSQKCCIAKNHVKFVMAKYYYHETSVIHRIIINLVTINGKQVCCNLAADETSRCALFSINVLIITILTSSNLTYEMRVTVHNKHLDNVCTFFNTSRSKQIGNKSFVLYCRTKIFRLRVRTSTQAAVYYLLGSAKRPGQAADCAVYYRFDAPSQTKDCDDVICAQLTCLYFLVEHGYYLNTSGSHYSRHLSRCTRKKALSIYTFNLDTTNESLILCLFNKMLSLKILIEFKCKNGSD